MHKVNNKHCRTGQRKCFLELKYSLNQSKDLAQAAAVNAASAPLGSRSSYMVCFYNI